MIYAVIVVLIIGALVSAIWGQGTAQGLMKGVGCVVLFVLICFVVLVLVVMKSQNIQSPASSPSYSTPTNPPSGGSISGIPHSFIERNVTLNGFGSYWVQPFNVRVPKTITVHIDAPNRMQANILDPAEVATFESGGACVGHCQFNFESGSKSCVLTPGLYYVGIRNSSNDGNPVLVELSSSP